MSVEASKDEAETTDDVQRTLTTIGLFAGIGGIELGLHRAGHHTVLLNEVWAPAQAVLKTRFPGVDLTGDVRTLDDLPVCDLIAAGFPCTDLSQAGRARGISGPQSSLVENVFRLLDRGSVEPRWVLIENVPFMLHLEGGRGMRHLVTRLERLGYRWAYRIVDARAFGLPQRRRRVVMLASTVDDPRSVLFGEDAAEVSEPTEASAYGFYWTEGLRGLGWAVDAVPTLKGGSSVGIPSSPAIWFPDKGLFATLDVRDAERLQGFDTDWTEPAIHDHKRGEGVRWKLVGNAVSVPLAHWLGEQLRNPLGYDGPSVELAPDARWPGAAWGEAGRRFRVPVSEYPVHRPRRPLEAILAFPVKPMSLKAIGGFRSRTDLSSLRFPSGFLDAVRDYERRVAERADKPGGIVRAG